MRQHGGLRCFWFSCKSEQIDRKHEAHHSFEKCAIPGTRQAAGEISGLDAGTDRQSIQVDNQSTFDRRHCAKFWAGKLGTKMFICLCEKSSRRRHSARTQRTFVLPNTSGTFVAFVRQWDSLRNLFRHQMFQIPKRRFVLSAVADADWARLADRRSATGGVKLLARDCVTSVSRTQASYALSSCESELYAMGSAAVGVLGIHAFLEEQSSLKEPPFVEGNNSSALPLAHHQGTGRLEHVEIRLLAIQSWVFTGRL